ncbi:MAG: class I SAM-dependent methyltransferase [Dehalococcoidia bacterium]
MKNSRLKEVIQAEHHRAWTGDSRFRRQDAQYVFPYHYLPDITLDGIVQIHQRLGWGLAYLTYMTYVRDRIVSLKPRSVLDVGCGDGRLLHMLADIVPVRAGVDLSARAIAFAEAFNPDVELFNCSVADVPGTFDLVTCVETLEHVPDTELPEFVSSLHDRLVRGGALILSVPTVLQPLSGKHWRHYTQELLEAQLAPYFSVLETVWVFRQSRLSRFLNRLLCNRVFVIEHNGVRKAIWRIHRRWSFLASSKDGLHLVALCRTARDRS